MTITDLSSPTIGSSSVDHGAIAYRADRDHHIRWRPGERLHHLFESRCDELTTLASAPMAVAEAGRTVTFVELEAMANRVAHRLLAEGCRPGDHLAVLLDRSSFAYAILLGISKIGAVYVPMDSAFPPDRLNFICDDAGVSLLIVHHHGPAPGSLTTPTLELDERSLAGLPTERPTVAQTGPMVTERSYVIYTSGSTGRPKGVPIDQGSICNFVRVAAEEYGYEVGDRVYQGLTIAFDFSVEEIWVPLLAGATLVPNQTGSSLVGDELADFLEAERVTALCCVPTLLTTVQRELPDLRLLVLSGEACPPELAERWHRTGRVLLNAYGPTETTVTATMSIIEPGSKLTIGQPLPTYSVVIVEPDDPRPGEPIAVLPRGEVGEIVIAGIGVAAGYLNRPDKTAAAFIPDSLGLPNNPSGLLYRSGDLGRILDTGEIEYLGRIDTQVKIRGYRIELTEIESALLAVPGVTSGVVDVHEPAPGRRELIAYYTCPDARGDAVTPRAVAEQLRNTLPAFMVPPHIELLAALPMMASDKVDRNALPGPSGRRVAGDGNGDEVVAPSSDLEHLMCEAMSEILGVDSVSIEVDFFDDLGADSLSMAELGAVLRSEIPDIRMRDFYEERTIARLAARVQTRDRSTSTTIVNDDELTRVSTFSYLACGVAQVATMLTGLYLTIAALVATLTWATETEQLVVVYGRAAAAAVAWFVVLSVAPIVAKWLLVGRWKAETFPLWGRRYYRFWFVRSLLALAPAGRMIGTPVQIAFERLLGADIDWSALLHARAPLCSDLVSIGADAVVMPGVKMHGYEARSGRMAIDGVTLGDRSFVGVGSVLGLATGLADDAQLAHASTLDDGEHVPVAQRRHGTPAEVSTTSFRSGTMPGWPRVSARRRVGFSVAILSWRALVVAPLPIVGWALGKRIGAADFVRDATLSPVSVLATGALIVALLALVALWGFAVSITLPRAARRLVRPGRDYRLYGIHHELFRFIERRTNSRFLNIMFGDSAAILHYLRAVGLRFKRIVQTGSNFGTTQRWDNPYCIDVGAATMVSDGLKLVTATYSGRGFRTDTIRIGDQNFFGNDVDVPVGQRAGDNVLVGTKTMLPIDGALHHDTGLLGSPAFEIPRSVDRDQRFARTDDPVALERDLVRKRRLNTRSGLVFAGSQWLFFATAILLLVRYERLLAFEQSTEIALVVAAIVVPGYVLYQALVERAVLGFKPLQPRFCSIYESSFWLHERYWKIGSMRPMALVRSTPLSGLLWRLRGVQVGARLFDDGAAIPEASLVSIGDDCVLNAATVIQGHSLEDGMFKSDHIEIGTGCSFGTNSFVHYGAVIGDGCRIGANAFVMKGQVATERTIWSGNPAAPLTASAD